MELLRLRKITQVNTMLKIKKFLKSENCQITLLVLLALVLRFSWFLYTDNNLDGDSEGRLLHLYNWMQFHDLSSFIDWLPLHFFLMQGLGTLLSDFINGPRLVSVFLGSLIIVPLYKIIRYEIGRRLAFLSSLFYALAAVYIPISTVTLSEITYTFFLLSTIGLLIKFLREREEKTFVMLTIFTCGLCWLRFEAWPLAALFFFILFCKRTSTHQLTFYASLVFIFCGSILGLGYHYTGDWFRGINYSDYQVIEAYKLHPTNKLLIRKFTRIIKAFYPTLFIFSLAGTFFLIKKKKMRVYLFCCWPIFLLLIYKIANNTVSPFMRYFVPTAILLIPIGIYGFWQIIKSHSWKIKIVFFLSALILEWSASLFFQNYYPYMLWTLPALYLLSLKMKSKQIVSYTFIIAISMWGYTRKPFTYGGFFHYQKGIETSAHWAKENLPRHSFIILDNSETNDQGNWCRQSGIIPNNLNVIITWPGLNLDYMLTKNYLDKTISAFDKIYFMTFKTGHLEKYINSRITYFESLNFNMMAIYEDEVAKIYQLSPVQLATGKDVE